MKEFGSDYHKITKFHGDHPDCPIQRKYQLYSCGRQALENLIICQRFKRIWFPDYYCHEIIEYISRRTGVAVRFYQDNPLFNDTSSISKISFKSGDALLRMNYFGHRGFRDESKLSVTVIEDHSHDLYGEWAVNSNSDWCIASLRKSFPIAEGGALWSPCDLDLPMPPNQSRQNETMANKRWHAMALKQQYLSNNLPNKDEYRRLFVETENEFNNLDVSAIDLQSLIQFNQINHTLWDTCRQNNINKIKTLLENATSYFSFLTKENDRCHEFSLILVFKSQEIRDHVRARLINNTVYPAILWTVPSTMSHNSIDFSRKSLSIACDGRYSEKDIYQLSKIILQSIV